MSNVAKKFHLTRVEPDFLQGTNAQHLQRLKQEFNSREILHLNHIEV